MQFGNGGRRCGWRYPEEQDSPYHRQDHQRLGYAPGYMNYATQTVSLLLLVWCVATTHGKIVQASHRVKDKVS
jgi:hypothetical protein